MLPLYRHSSLNNLPILMTVQTYDQLSDHGIVCCIRTLVMETAVRSTLLYKHL